MAYRLIDAVIKAPDDAELRLVLGKIELLVPGDFSVFGIVDTGRVFYAKDPDDADKWHTGVGGRFW